MDSVYCIVFDYIITAAIIFSTTALDAAIIDPTVFVRQQLTQAAKKIVFV